MSESNPSIETLAPGLTLQFLADGRIRYITFANAHRETIDAYVENSLESIAQADATSKRLTLLDFTPAAVMVSPYLRQRNEAVINALQERNLEGRTAIAVIKSPLTQLARIAINNYAKRTPEMEIRLFLDVNPAIKWLEAAL